MNKNSDLYFWIDSEVKITDWDSLDSLFYDVLCVDMGSKTENGRYGMFTMHRWKHVPLSEFPKEFQMALLILGVV